SQEYYKRFPNLRESLERMFRMDGWFGDEQLSGNGCGSDSARLPVEGEKFLDFRLKAQLGRGAFACVFLAEQMNLSGRRVVVKITPHRTIEHRTMARLEHPNIVPILSVHQHEAT